MRVLQDMRKAKKDKETEREGERERRIPIKISNSKFAINSMT